jgi:hypothetical protein
MADQSKKIVSENGQQTKDEFIVTPITNEDLDRSIHRLAEETAASGHFRPGGLLMPDYPEDVA